MRLSYAATLSWPVTEVSIADARARYILVTSREVPVGVADCPCCDSCEIVKRLATAHACIKLDKSVSACLLFPGETPHQSLMTGHRQVLAACLPTL